jgi:hypothetical protein
VAAALLARPATVAPFPCEQVNWQRSVKLLGRQRCCFLRQRFWNVECPIKVTWFYSSVTLLACCLFADSSRAQQKTDPCERPVTSPATGTVTLTLKGGRSVYHEGEIIPLELTFSYSLVQYRPRTGRNLRAFAFCLTPEGRDPLQDDEESGLWGSAGGSFGSGPYDVFDPGVTYVDDMELNEWKSVPPGNYSLRMGISNEVKFQVLPATPEWQAEQLASAMAVLDADHAKDTPSDMERTKQAVRVLRFLGSEASTRELARRFWFYDRQRQVHPISAEYPINPFFYGYERSQDYWDIKAGLIASPYRAVAIEELTAAIHDPQHPATRAMVETLALLEIQSKTEYPRFIPMRQYGQVELRSPTPDCPLLVLPCASHPSQQEKRRLVKGAAYDGILDALWKQVNSNP